MKLTSLEALRQEIETALEDRDWDKAWGLIVRGGNIKQDDPILLFLTAIYHEKTGNSSEATALLEELTEMGITSPEIRQWQKRLSTGEAP